VVAASQHVVRTLDADRPRKDEAHRFPLLFEVVGFFEGRQ
jgi:hypothetical protein